MSNSGGTPAEQGTGFVLFQQNMALTPPLQLPGGGNLYRGTDRAGSLESLVSLLDKTRPAVVGLSEMWLPEERQLILDRLDTLYPYCLQGPGQATEQMLDGGLLLLSNSPWLDSGQWIYTACLGEDCLCQKGILYARIQPGGRPAVLDIFLTHLQNPTPLMDQPDVGPGLDGRAKVRDQQEQLAAFIRRHRNPAYPALLLGDLNTDFGAKEAFDDMLVRLEHPADLWLATKAVIPPLEGRDPTLSSSGLTFDEASTFHLAKDAGPVETQRFRRGKRLDYFLSYPGSRWLASYQNTRVVRLESSPGRDSSDHYGLMTELVQIKQL